jgi:hypothetical protein
LVLLCALPAKADVFKTGGGGIFLGYSFGEHGGFQWGLEAFGTRYLEKHSFCESKARHGFGPLARLSFVKVSRLELTLALHGGGELPQTRSFFDLDGELGASLFIESDQEVQAALHTGVLFESLIFNTYLRQEWLTPSLSVGGGVRYLPTFGEPGFCIVD